MSACFKTGIWLGLILSGFWLVAGTAHAHKVNIFAWVENGQVYTQSKFSGGKRVKEGTIEVFDHQDNKILEGTTDGQGNFAFPVPTGAASLKIIVTSGMGHTNHWEITPQELGASEPASLPNPGAIAPKEPADHYVVDPADLEKAVEKALDKKLAPLRAQLAEQAWGLRDIIGGLGYILGLMGLASYLHHRKMRTSKTGS